MSQHSLQGRTENEVTWFQRRGFLSAAAAWSAMGGWGAAQAQSRSNIVELQGDAMLNGSRLLPGQTIQSGDNIATGPGSTLTFVIGNASFHVRQNSRLAVERGRTLSLVSVLRVLTGAVGSAWGRGSQRQVVTPTLTAGIRGTGVYTEVLPLQGYRSYFCNCYGTVDMRAGGDRAVSTASYHQSFWGEAVPKGGRLLTPAKAINHTDEEMEFLARLINEKTTWQIEGRKGSKDGKGYLDEKPDEQHPALMIGK